MSGAERPTGLIPRLCRQSCFNRWPRQRTQRPLLPGLIPIKRRRWPPDTLPARPSSYKGEPSTSKGTIRMTPPLHSAADAALSVAVPAGAAFELAPPRALAIPRYLEQVYWWAYVHPNAVQLFEREWLDHLIHFGQYGPLRDAPLAGLR